MSKEEQLEEGVRQLGESIQRLAKAWTNRGMHTTEPVFKHAVDNLKISYADSCLAQLNPTNQPKCSCTGSGHICYQRPESQVSNIPISKLKIGSSGNTKVDLTELDSGWTPPKKRPCSDVHPDLVTDAHGGFHE